MLSLEDRLTIALEAHPPLNELDTRELKLGQLIVAKTEISKWLFEVSGSLNRFGCAEVFVTHFSEQPLSSWGIWQRPDIQFDASRGFIDKYVIKSHEACDLTIATPKNPELAVITAPFLSLSLVG